MKIPQIVKIKNREYIFVKEYKTYIRYKDKETGSMICFNKQELGLIKEMIKPPIYDLNLKRRKL